ncbi:unnamed protein product [Ectocarpus sp. 6 AP-2014]
MGFQNYRALPEDIFEGMLALEFIGLALTNLESVPEGLFDNTPNLVSLELSENGLSEVPAGLFANTPKLETLALSRCQISALPAGLFASVPALQSLDLTIMELETLPEGIFQNTPLMSFLRLRENNIVTLPEDVFEGAVGLEELDMSLNEIVTLPPGIFGPLTSLVTLDMTGNDDLQCIPESSATDVTSDDELPACEGEETVEPTPAPEVTPEATEEPETPGTAFRCTGDAGILQGDACCETSCGVCGGTGCSDRGNGQDSCCTKNIAANGDRCSETGAAPCIVDAPEPETSFSCSSDAGILQGDICCEASCGTCGGTGCSDRGYGQDSCCTKNIAANGDKCSETGAAPCVVDGNAPAPTPEATPEPETPGTAFSCFGDAGILNDDVCCEAACGTCGGPGCTERPGGDDACCVGDIRDNGEKCIEKGAAPCIV